MIRLCRLGLSISRNNQSRFGCIFGNMDSGNEYQQASRYMKRRNAIIVIWWEERSCSSSSSNRRSSSDDAFYSYTLLVYTHIHWTFISSLSSRSFVLRSLSIRTKKSWEEKEREREKRIRLEAKRGREGEREKENWLWYWLLIIVDEKRRIEQLYHRHYRRNITTDQIDRSQIQRD